MTDTNQSSLVGNAASGDGPADLESQPGGLRRAGRFAFKVAFMLGGLFLLYLLGVMLMSSVSPHGMASFRDKLAKADSGLMFVRLLLIGLLIVFWRPINTWLSNRNGWSEAYLQRVLIGRWWAFAILLFVELILVQRLHESLLSMVN